MPCIALILDTPAGLVGVIVLMGLVVTVLLFLIFRR